MPALASALPSAGKAIIGSAGLHAIGNLGSGSSGTSESWGSGGSLGSSASESWDNWSQTSNSWGLSNSWDNAENWSNGWSDAWSVAKDRSESTTFGREASAQDVQNAYQQYLLQRDLWSDQAAYNAKQAEIDREFQREMSNTAYQRAVADLLKAGLNPILAVGNMGATTPVGAMASSGLGVASKANAHASQYSYSEGYANSGSKSGSSSYGYKKGGSSSQSGSSSYGSGSGGSKSSSHESSGYNQGSTSQYSNNAKTALESVGDIAKNAVGALKNYLKNPVPTPTH